jgi:hypothetical protein
MAVEEHLCPFCLLPYTDMYDLVVGALVIDKVFVHHIQEVDDEGDSYARVCPIPDSYRIQEIVIDEQARTVEVILDRP